MSVVMVTGHENIAVIDTTIQFNIFAINSYIYICINIYMSYSERNYQKNNLYVVDNGLGLEQHVADWILGVPV